MSPGISNYRSFCRQRQIPHRRWVLTHVLFFSLFLSSVIAGLTPSTIAASEIPQHHQSDAASTKFSSDLIKASSTGNILHISIDEILRLGSRTAMKKALDETIPRVPEDQAFEFVSECESISDLDLRRLFLRVAFSHLTRIDIRRTLRRFDELHSDDQLLVIESIYENVESEDAEEALSILKNVTWDMQEMALLAFLSSPRNISNEQLFKIAKLVPIFAVPFLAELKDRDARIEFAENLVQHWAEEDVQVSIRLIEDLHGLTLDERLLVQTTVALVPTHPIGALEITHDFFREFGFSFEQEIFIRIARLHPDVALELLPVLRTGYPLDAQLSKFDLPSTFFNLDPTHAIEFGSLLTEYESRIYFRKLLYAVCTYEAQLLAGKFNTASWSEILSKASGCALLESRHRERLNEEEFNLLYSYLLPTERTRVDEYPKASFIQPKKK